MVEEISLYFHIPFCTKKCPYCHFYVLKDSLPLKKSYFLGLQREWGEKLPLISGKKIVSIYFGGGTPSLLSTEEFDLLFSLFKNLFLSSDIEITLEANPETLTLPLLQHVSSLGVNRISLGVQSLDDELLTLIGRTHDTFKSFQAIDLIRMSGIDNISIDLMYDLPNQTISQFTKTVRRAVTLPITHLSLYNLTIEPHTIFYRDRDNLHFPKDEESLMMLREAISHFESHGFERYEISAFCKPSFQSRHNKGYWMGRPFLGFGPSAFSYWNKRRFSNISHLLDYEKKENPINFSEELSPNAHYKELLAIRLRLLTPFSLSMIPGRVPDDVPVLIENLIKEGYIQEKYEQIALTSKGTFFYDFVAESLIEV